MNRLNRLVTRIFLYLSPLAILLFLIDHRDPSLDWPRLKAIYWVAGSLLVVWFLAGVYFFSGLLISRGFRESVLTRLANLRERDEREERIVGHASRQTFLLMLAVLLALFAASTVRYGVPDRGPREAKDYTLTLGYWGLLETHTDTTPMTLLTPDGKQEKSVRLYDLPLSKSGLLLALILLQVITYRLSARKLLAEGEGLARGRA